MVSAAAAADDDRKAAAFISGLATVFALQMRALDESHALAVLSVLLDVGIDLNKFRVQRTGPADSTLLLQIASMYASGCC